MHSTKLAFAQQQDLLYDEGTIELAQAMAAYQVIGSVCQARQGSTSPALEKLQSTLVKRCGLLNTRGSATATTVAAQKPAADLKFEHFSSAKLGWTYDTAPGGSQYVCLLQSLTVRGEAARPCRHCGAASAGAWPGCCAPSRAYLSSTYPVCWCMGCACTCCEFRNSKSKTQFTDAADMTTPFIALLQSRGSDRTGSSCRGGTGAVTGSQHCYEQASDAKAAAAEQLHRACLETGFFYVKNHGALRC